MIGRYYHTLRYLRPVQVWSRLVLPFRRFRHVDRKPLPLRNRCGSFIEPVRRPPMMTGPARFRFLNLEGEILHASHWNSSDWPLLWLYNAHYFDDLNSAGADIRTAWHLELIDRWIRENPLGKGVGWAPYPTSLRIVNWIKWDLETGMLDEEARKSLAQQARWLRGCLEYHLLGNHLLANLKAVIFAALYFAGREPDAWYADAVRRLAPQISEQVLGDGGHIERSPMYHAIVLEDILDLVNVHRTYGMGVPSTMLNTASKMLYWLEAMTHPDGEIALFNDSAIGVAANFEALLSYAIRLGILVPERVHGRLLYLKDSGYVRICSGPVTAFLDLAPVGPDYLPGHAHADTLSFELSVGGERVFVDSGTSTYQAGQVRDFQRSTRAHNTVVIDELNSSDVWGAFRVGQRARVFDVLVQETEGYLFVSAAHDGYRRLPGRVIHRRTWKLEQRVMVIEDSIEGVGRHYIEVRFHVHPSCQVVREGDRVLIATPGGQKVVLASLTPGTMVDLQESSYSPEFGLEYPNRVVGISLTAHLPTVLRTSISW